MDTRQAWVRDAASRDAECRRVAGLAGRQLRAGRYFDIGRTKDAPSWARPEFHALDYGLELDFADGATWSFIWQTIRPWEGLLACEGTLLGHEILLNADCTVRPIKSMPAWKQLIGSIVTSIESAWEDFGEAQSPFSWIIHFDEARQIVITLGAHDDHDGFRPSADDVAVFFSLDSARRHGVELTSR